MSLSSYLTVASYCFCGMLGSQVQTVQTHFSKDTMAGVQKCCLATGLLGSYTVQEEHKIAHSAFELLAPLYSRWIAI